MFGLLIFSVKGKPWVSFLLLFLFLVRVTCVDSVFHRFLPYCLETAFFFLNPELAVLASLRGAPRIHLSLPH